MTASGIPTVAVPPPPLRERRWLPPIVVSVVIAGVVFGGYAVAGSLSVPAGLPVTVGGVVRVFPLEGWEAAGTFTQPPGIRLAKGSGALDVAAVPFPGDELELLRQYVEEVLEPDADQLSVSEIGRVQLGGGRTGARAVYVGSFGDVQAPIEGQVTAVVTGSGDGVIFDGWAPSGLLQYVIDDIEAMVANAEIEG